MRWKGGVRQRLKHRDVVPQSGPSNASSSGDTLSSALGDAFLQNKLSAKQVQKLAVAGVVSGARDAVPLAATGSHGKHPGNMARDISRQLLRKLPKGVQPYWFELPLWNKDLNTTSVVSYPLLLPHELLADHMMKLGSKTVCAKRQLMSWDIVQTFAVECQCPPELVVPMGLWGDGVPFKKKDSLEMLTLNFLGDFQGQRHLLIGIEHKHLCQCGSCFGRHSMDVVFKVLQWSFTMCFLGRWPSTRHDGGLWLDTDSNRKALSGKSLPAMGGLLQLRADWKWLHAFLAFPHWGAHSLCAWCNANTTSCPWKDTSPEAAWRTQRRTERDFFDELVARGVSPSPLFSVPGFGLHLVHLDWLHVVDLGCAADIIGSTLWEALDFQEGHNRKNKVRMLWAKLVAYYRRTVVASKLDNLTVEMLWAPGQPSPKLKAKGAECRGVQAFSLEIAQQLATTQKTEHWLNIQRVNQSLVDLTATCSYRPYNWERAARSCQSLAIAWELLASEERSVWQLKPKLHLLQEMVEIASKSLGSPELYWTYKDEDFGGKCAELARTRGGAVSPAGFGLRLLQKHCSLGPR